MTVIETVKNSVVFIRALMRWAFDPTAGTITGKYLENGVEKTFSLWNAKKIETIHTDFLNGSRDIFVGNDIISSNWANNVSTTYVYGNSGDISHTVGSLIHTTNANGLYTTQSDFEVNGTIEATFPKHPLAARKEAIFDAVIVDIKNPDTTRNFSITTEVNNIAPFSEDDSFVSQGSTWIYFSRDVKIDIPFACAVEYPYHTEIYVDGVLHNGSISRGWHKITSFNKRGKVAYQELEVIRFFFSNNDTLSDLKMVITHVSALVNTPLSAVLKPKN